MNKRLSAGGFLVVLALLASGCVTQQRYDELKFAERNCNAERQRLATDLANSQVQNTAIQKQLSDLENLLGLKQQAISSLEKRSSSAQETLAKMTKIYEDLASRSMPGNILLQPLPAELDSALKKFAQEHPGMVQYDSARGVLKFGSDVLFDLGSDTVAAKAVSSISELAAIIGSPAASEFDVVIVGHTDNVRIGKPSTKAKHPTNWHLSVHRAISVMYLMRDGGITSERMGVMGYGEFRPVAPNDSAANRSQNRRVEVYLVPKQAIGERTSKAAPKVKEEK